MRLCEWYQTGNGVSKDAIEAAKWWRKAIENPEAVKVSRILAERGEASAQWDLAERYILGRGVGQDYAEATCWYLKAAEHGHAMAQLELGRCYYNGIGVSTNYVEAIRWFRKAADRGLAEAQCVLAFCYTFGQGAATNYSESVKWTRKAADQGNARAQAMLGAFYASGRGIPRNDVEAYKWLSLATAQNLPNDAQALASDSLNSVEMRMSRLEIIEAQRLAAAFLPREEAEASEQGKGFQIIVPDVMRPKATGTGFFITGDGFLVTNGHVVRDATQIRLVTSAGLISAKVVKMDF